MALLERVSTLVRANLNDLIEEYLSYQDAEPDPCPYHHYMGMYGSGGGRGGRGGDLDSEASDDLGGARRRGAPWRRPSALPRPPGGGGGTRGAGGARGQLGRTRGEQRVTRHRERSLW